MRDLQGLLAWLEYGRESGYISTRESMGQELFWADRLRAMLALNEQLLEACRSALPVMEKALAIRVAIAGHRNIRDLSRAIDLLKAAVGPSEEP